VRKVRALIWCALLIIPDINSFIFPWTGTVGILLLEDGLKAYQSRRGRMEILAIKVGEEGPAENTTRLGVLYLYI
jgi:hypothetical protein